MGSQVALQAPLTCLVGINSGPVLYFFLNGYCYVPSFLISIPAKKNTQY